MSNPPKPDKLLTDARKEFLNNDGQSLIRSSTMFPTVVRKQQWLKDLTGDGKQKYGPISQPNKQT